MKTRNALLPAVAALLSGVWITPPVQAQESSDRGRAEDAATTKARLGAPLIFDVDGLTKDNIAQVERSLTSLKEDVYVCSGCRHTQATMGKCEPCNLDLRVKKETVLSEAVPSLEDGNIRLTPFAARTLSYSALERVLMQNSIKIDGATFPLAGESRLVLRGGQLDNVETVEDALKGPKLFDRAQASYDLASTEIHVSVHAGGTPPMHDEVASIIDALETKATLADVVWGPPVVPAKT